MGNAPAANFQTTVATPTTPVPYLNHALITFRPINSTFGTNFAASTQSWMFAGLVAELGPDNWQSRLKSLGAPTTEPIWTALAAFFGPLAVADGNGNRERVQKPDVVYIGRRTSAVVSVNTVTFDTNTAGSTRVRINRSQYLYSGSSPAGSLADVTITADGVKTVADLADELAAALTAVTAFAAVFTAVSDAVDTVTITSLVAGYPLICDARSTTPGPTISQVVTTANVANAYRDDLLEMQTAAEFTTDDTDAVAQRRWYWITDLQGDDVVNAEGLAFAQNQADPGQFTPPRFYQFCAWSTSGARRIQIGADYVGNFDPTSTDSAAQTAHEANGGSGWNYGSVHDHPRYEFLVPALLGRCIAYLPGEIAFTARVLQGDTAAAKMSPLGYGDDESLILADERSFCYYSDEGPGQLGMSKYGGLSDGSFMDRPWLAAYVTYFCTVDVLQEMQLKNITTYTDADIAAYAAVIKGAIAKVPAVIKDSIGVVSLTRSQVNPANIVARIYFDYTGSGTSGGIINRFGTPSSPIPITIVDG